MTGEVHLIYLYIYSEWYDVDEVHSWTNFRQGRPMKSSWWQATAVLDITKAQFLQYRHFHSQLVLAFLLFFLLVIATSRRPRNREQAIK